ncbi:MAG: putative ABC transporter permease [Anaeroplasma sp.]
MIFIDYFLYFILYSFLGYICEVIYVSICTKKITNRGFLYSPLCPIYGFGAIIIILMLNWAYDYWCLVLILGIILTSLLEYGTSLAMEQIFHMRWWDYSNKKYNLNGRICLKNSLMFGALVMLVIYLIHPYVVKKFVDLITNETIKTILFSILFVGLITDTVFSTIKHVSISRIMVKLEALSLDIDLKKSEISTYLNNTKIMKKIHKISIKYPSMVFKNNVHKLKISIEDIIRRLKNRLNGE